MDQISKYSVEYLSSQFTESSRFDGYTEFKKFITPFAFRTLKEAKPLVCGSSDSAL